MSTSSLEIYSWDTIFARLEVLSFSPIFSIGVGLLVAQLFAGIADRLCIPRIYGPVLAGILFGSAFLGFIDGALLAEFQVLVSVAASLVLFDLGRRFDLRWAMAFPVFGLSVFVGYVCFAILVCAGLMYFGHLEFSNALFVAMLSVASSSIIYLSVVHQNAAAGSATHSAVMALAWSNILALLGTSAAMGLLSEKTAQEAFMPYLGGEFARVFAGAVSAYLMYLIYRGLSSFVKADDQRRGFILIGCIFMNLGMCLSLGMSTLVSMLVLGVLLRSREVNSHVFQAKFESVQEVGFFVLILVASANVPWLTIGWQAWGMAAGILTIKVLLGSWVFGWWAPYKSKRWALSLMLASFTSIGALSVDATFSMGAALAQDSSSIMQALMGLSLLVSPALVYAGIWLSKEGKEHAL